MADPGDVICADETFVAIARRRRVLLCGCIGRLELVLATDFGPDCADATFAGTAFAMVTVDVVVFVESVELKNNCSKFRLLTFSLHTGQTGLLNGISHK